MDQGGFFSFLITSPGTVRCGTGSGAVFDMAIEAQRGKGGFQDVGLNAIKGFFEASLFTIVPVDSYVICINILPDVILDFMCYYLNEYYFM